MEELPAELQDCVSGLRLGPVHLDKILQLPLVVLRAEHEVRRADELDHVRGHEAVVRLSRVRGLARGREHAARKESEAVQEEDLVAHLSPQPRVLLRPLRLVDEEADKGCRDHLAVGRRLADPIRDPVRVHEAREAAGRHTREHELGREAEAVGEGEVQGPVEVLLAAEVEVPAGHPGHLHRQRLVAREGGAVAVGQVQAVAVVHAAILHGVHAEAALEPRPSDGGAQDRLRPRLALGHAGAPAPAVEADRPLLRA
mmetsp:Transcript_36602/g.108775  ORF Transcript_36602/g.108775 Transcript_36602/m.108775 type:complete len:256 (+) Transcript_36602:335-1102(+)